jgi:hypothetical protein
MWHGEDRRPWVPINIRDDFGERAWHRYGFVDALNPLTGWYDPDVVGINLGITMLLAENLRTRLAWNMFMKKPETAGAMTAAGFH